MRFLHIATFACRNYIVQSVGYFAVVFVVICELYAKAAISRSE